MEKYSDDALLVIIWDYLQKDDVMPQSADAIIIGGSGHDLGMAARAATLYHQGVSARIITSGFAPPSYHDPRTEAERLAEALSLRAVSKDSIFIEPFASNTGENIVFSQKLLALHVSEVKNIILIHKPYMSRRFFATALAQWQQPQPTFFVTHEQISFEEYCQRETKDIVVRSMLGDFKRMNEYVDKGFQVAQPITPQSQDAYEELLKRGYQTR
jgi:uncharacterized SAM-binding protein YcdF (DUF218 family)